MGRLCLWGAGNCGKSPHLPLEFAVNLKLLYKFKSLKNPVVLDGAGEREHAAGDGAWRRRPCSALLGSEQHAPGRAPGQPSTTQARRNEALGAFFSQQYIAELVITGPQSLDLSGKRHSVLGLKHPSAWQKAAPAATEAKCNC